MSKLVYIVAAAGSKDCDERYIIDSVWTSSRKAQKRAKELNSKGLEYLLETKTCGLFEVRQKWISK